MNVAKPGGPAGPSQISPEGAPGAGGANPAGPERKFADVLANKAGGPGQAPPGSQSQQVFRAPILDDGPAGISRTQMNPVDQTQRADKSKRVYGAIQSIEVRGERSGRPPGLDKVDGQQGMNWQRMADDTFKSETRIDNLIKAAQGGKAFNASELMALQVEVFRYSQTVEVISRTTDKLVGAIKQTLGTQV